MLRNQAHALLLVTSTSRRRCRRRRSCGRSSSGIITIAKRGVAGGDANGKALHARRLVLRDIHDRDVVSKLFDTIAPRFEDAAGRLHAHPAPRLPPRRQRRGGADRAGRQRVQPATPRAEQRPKPRQAKPKGVGGRLRAAAERLRGKKAEPAEGEGRADTRRRSRHAKRARAAGPTRAARAQDVHSAQGGRLVRARGTVCRLQNV